jgi:hypothetical protein
MLLKAKRCNPSLQTVLAPSFSLAVLMTPATERTTLRFKPDGGLLALAQ